MKRTEAIKFLQEIMDVLGNGFHPDNFLAEYSDRSGKASFDESKVDELQDKLDQAIDVIGKDLYPIINLYLGDDFSGKSTVHVQMDKVQVEGVLDLINSCASTLFTEAPKTFDAVDYLKGFLEEDLRELTKLEKN